MSAALVPGRMRLVAPWSSFPGSSASGTMGPGSPIIADDCGPAIWTSGAGGGL